MNTKACLSIVVCLTVALVFARPTRNEQTAKTCTLSIEDRVPHINDSNGNYLYETVLVTLYRKGEAVRSTELSSRYTNEASATWTQLDPGQYEVHFEAQKHGTIVKKLVLSPDAPSTTRVDALGDKDETYGAGPTLFELEKRIAALEKPKS